jgi:hypothetical protein
VDRRRSWCDRGDADLESEFLHDENMVMQAVVGGGAPQRGDELVL